MFFHINLVLIHNYQLFLELAPYYLVQNMWQDDLIHSRILFYLGIEYYYSLHLHIYLIKYIERYFFVVFILIKIRVEEYQAPRLYF